VNVPVLETERLILRGHRLEDFPAYAAMWADPLFMRHMGPPRSAEESWSRFLRNMGMWSLLGHGLWAVEEKASGAFVGDCGFMQNRRGLPIDCGDLPEAGWTFVTAAHGKGIGSEASRAAITWADERLGASRTWCLIAESNEISQKLAARMGYRQSDRVMHLDKPALIFTRERP
jgi:RimJ/RimL family protein N-acetyltransferase